MRAVIQKSGPARVEIEGATKGKIESGLVVLLGITHDDNESDIDFMIEKIVNMRLFEEGEKHFEKSISENSKEILVVSQFTLYANCKKGRRPDFNDSAKPEIAKPTYEKFLEKLEAKGMKVQSGEFGAMMYVSLTNEGPITIILDSKN